MSDNLKYVGVALVAAGVGAAVALLVAPDNGRATRRRLLKRMDKERRALARESRRLLDDAKGYIDDQVEQGRKTVEKTVQSLTEQAFDQLDQGKRKITKMVGA
jgi:gas vesicle protein